MKKACRLGAKYTDSVTGFTGKATARTIFLYGCVRICLEGSEEGKPVEYWFDEQRLKTNSPAKTGGNQKSAPRKTTG